jgi:steroid delta-isomerase-like uncharacterized protein
VGAAKDLWNQFEALTNKHDWSGAASLFATDAVYVSPAGRNEGREAIRAYSEQADRAVPDGVMETSLFVEEGDMVVAEWTFRGTHTGVFAGPNGTEVAATGKALDVAIVSVAMVTDGMFATVRDYYDQLEYMTQLGLMPSG